jgi:hypothetical protein
MPRLMPVYCLPLERHDASTETDKLIGVGNALRRLDLTDRVLWESRFWFWTICSLFLKASSSGSSQQIVVCDENRTKIRKTCPGNYGL